MNIAIPFHPKLFETPKNYSSELFRRDFGAGLNVMVMEKAGFLDRIGRENVCPHIDAALDRARNILGLPPALETDPLHQERQKLEAVRRELTGALERANEVMQTPVSRSRALLPVKSTNTLVSGNGKPTNGNGKPKS
jgi:hypothetical protein